MNFVVTDHISDGRCQAHNLKNRNVAAVHIRDQLLGNNRLKDHGKLDSDLTLLGRFKDMRNISRFIEEKLGLKVNMTKSKVDKPQGLKYLGFGFYFDSRAYQFKAKPHAKSVAKFKKRMKELTCRSWGVSNSCKVEKLNQLIRGWINYFKIGSMKRLCKELDSRIRYRLRMCIWKQWKTPQNRIKNLMKLGVDKDTAWITAYTGSRIAYVCQRRVMNFAINKERLTKFGLVSMLDYYTERCVTC